MKFDARLTQLIDLKSGGNKKKFSALTGIPYTSITEYAKGLKTDPKISFIHKIKQAIPNVNALWLLHGEGEMLIGESGIELDLGIPKVVSVSEDGDENIVFVAAKAAAGYLNGYDNPNYIETLPNFRLPQFKDGTYRMFEVSGHSMRPTLKDTDMLICQWVESFDHIRNGRVYAIVTLDEGIVVKRVVNKVDQRKKLILTSDNRRDYPSYSIDAEKIVELWYVKAVLTYQLPEPGDLYNRVVDLEAEVTMLKESI